MSSEEDIFNSIQSLLVLAFSDKSSLIKKLFSFLTNLILFGQLINKANKISSLFKPKNFPK